MVNVRPTTIERDFLKAELYDLCQVKEPHYVIQIKRNPRLYKLAEQFVQVVAETEWSKQEEYFYSLRYQAGTWKRRTMENCIKAGKNGFFFDKTDSFYFLENAVRIMLRLGAIMFTKTNFFIFYGKFNPCLGETRLLKKSVPTNGLV